MPGSPTDDAADRVRRAYEKTQSLDIAEVPASGEELADLARNWQAEELPGLQRTIANLQLANLAQGIVDPVFAALATALKAVDLPSFSLLDAACATGYYGEVIHSLDPRDITYSGCDYSPAMIESARAYYPDVPFSVQDLTALTHPDRSFDVVLLSGVLEHIPDYRRAIERSSRVADRYLIVHRCPTTSGPTHERTIGTQYNIRTPRTFFSLGLLKSEFSDTGFELVKSVEVYPRPGGWRRRLRRMAGRRLKGREQRGTLTLVFRRREASGRP